MTKEECGNCKFWKRLPHERSNGECRREPPKVFVFGPGNRCQFRPETDSDEWCGQYQPDGRTLMMREEEDVDEEY